METIINKILEDGYLSIPHDRPPLQEKEVISQAEDALGQVPDWYLHHKEVLLTYRQQVESTTKHLQKELTNFCNKYAELLDKFDKRTG